MGLFVPVYFIESQKRDTQERILSAHW